MDAIYNRLLAQIVEEYKNGEDGDFYCNVFNNVIKTIDGIPVFITIQIEKEENKYTSNLCITVSPNNVVQQICKFEFQVNKKEIKKIIELYVEVISKLKFDNSLGVFQTENSKNNRMKDFDDLETKEAMMCFLESKNVSNIEYKLQKCCVCMSITQQTTKCNHTLCVRCFLKLPNKMCPICRANELELKDPIEENL